MPALPSFINYKPGRKTKAAIKSPFSLLRGETTSIPAPPTTQFFTTEVIDINDRGARYSLDFDGGKPIDEYENDIIDKDLPQTRTDTTSSPQDRLNIDLPQGGGLTDWFTANFLQTDGPQVPKALKAGPSGVRKEVREELPAVGGFGTFNGQSSTRILGGEDEDEALAISSDDVIANLQAMDASHFGRLPRLEFNRLEQAPPLSLRPSANLVIIPNEYRTSTNGQSIRSSGTMSSFKSPLSNGDTPVSSAISGTTLARALLSNTFSLANDNRTSRYRSGGGAGLTRSDSNTLPRGDHAPTASLDRFSIGPDAPPIPANAEFLYEPPKKSRGAEWREKRKQTLKRRSSTGSLHAKALPDTPSATSSRPISALISPGFEFEMEARFKSPTPLTPPSIPRSPSSIPRSPLPLPPTPKPTISVNGDKGSDHGFTFPPRLPEGTRRLPTPNTPSPDHSLLSPSPAPSSDGVPYSKNVEDVLNYYSAPSPEPLLAGAIYRPAFSPISEETSSQLSPPTPYRNERRDSQRNTPIGARSPMSTRARADSSTMSKWGSYSNQSLIPLTEGVASDAQSTSPSDSQRSSLVSSEFLAPLAPPVVSAIFKRQRSGSAPSPVQVIRNPTDQNAYNITVTTLQPHTQMASSEEGVFPETPDMFTPGDPELFHSSENHEVVPMPTTPTSAAIHGRGNAQPTLSQQFLLNRAATTVRHSRQTSIGKIKTTGIGGRSGSPARRVEAAETKFNVQGNGGAITRLASSSREDVYSESPEEHLSASSLIPPSAIDGIRSPSRGTTHTDEGSMYTSSESSKSRLKTLPAIPVSSFVSASPAATTPPPTAAAEPAPATIIVPTVPFIPPPPSIPPPSPTLSQRERARAPPARDRARLPPALTLADSNSSASTVAVNGNDNSPGSSDHHHPVAQPVAPSHVPDAGNTLPAQGSLQYKDNIGRFDPFRGTSLGSPPPYYSVVHDTPIQAVHNAAPANPIFNGTALFSEPTSGPIAGPSTTSPDWTGSDPRSALARESSMMSQRARPRPPLPAGPRRPSQQQVSTPSSYHLSMSRDRSGSVSSVASSSLLQQASGATRRSGPTPIMSPKFQTPPPKWRGYTMEAAKWTFTSAQLQAIVSRAIRQSAEASSIRLLRLEVLDNELPDEMKRLEVQRTDLKTRYKVLTRRRTTLLDSLSNYMVGTGEDDPASGLRLIEELRELAATLDKLAEELHSLDGQLSHLQSLTHIHTGSALAMALRKLNASFLKQVAENQVLRNQVQGLEAESKEAWIQAESIAHELDKMNDVIESPTSRRSSRVSAFRKSRSSIRLSKAAPSLRFSQISSLSSGAFGSALPSSSKSPMLRLSEIPPVPPIPRRRPFDILTDSPLKSSAAFSATGYTPSSANKALVEAQDELYAMLGLTNPERVIRRSRSMDGLPITSPPLNSSGHGMLHPPLAHPESSSSSRRSSLPPVSTLTEAYHAMEADRNAVLATIEMLSSTD